MAKIAEEAAFMAQIAAQALAAQALAAQVIPPWVRMAYEGAAEVRAAVLAMVRLSWQRSPAPRVARRSRATRRTSGNSSPPSDDGDGPAPSTEQHPRLLAFRFPRSTRSSYQFFRPHAAPGAPLRSAGGACFSPER
jgi:hypothetical protein